MKSKAPQLQARDQVSGQYAYEGNWDRLCVCGHRLGDHIAGGFDCGLFHHTKGCKCQKFRPSKRRVLTCAKDKHE